MPATRQTNYKRFENYSGFVNQMMNVVALQVQDTKQLHGACIETKHRDTADATSDLSPVNEVATVFTTNNARLG